MSLVLSVKQLRGPLEAIHKNPTDPEALKELLEIVAPVIKLTAERFPFHLADDIRQELQISMMKKAPYLAKAFVEGTIDSPTGYIFRLLFNEASTALGKELKHEQHLVSIEDVKVENTVMNKTGKKHKVIEKIREELIEWTKQRFEKASDAKSAQRYIEVMIEGKRPSFHTTALKKFKTGRDQNAKDIYSAVFQRLRERLEFYWDEIHED